MTSNDVAWQITFFDGKGRKIPYWTSDSAVSALQKLRALRTEMPSYQWTMERY